MTTRAEPHAFLVVGGKGREIQAVDLDDAFVRPTPAVALALRVVTHHENSDCTGDQKADIRADATEAAVTTRTLTMAARSLGSTFNLLFSEMRRIFTCLPNQHEFASAWPTEYHRAFCSTASCYLAFSASSRVASLPHPAPRANIAPCGQQHDSSSR